MANFIPHNGASTAPKDRRAKYQNFYLNKNGTYFMQIGQIIYPEIWALEDIPTKGVALRDERRRKQCMSKAKY